MILIKYSAHNLVSNLNLAANLEDIDRHYTARRIIKIIKEIKLARQYLEANVNPKLTLENLVLNF